MQSLVTIILPVRNEGKFIVNCLQSIAAQDYPKECMELLIVDGLSDDDTLDQIAEFDSGYDDFHIQVLTNTRLTVPHAMNLGIKAARGGIILRFDGHSIMAPDYVSNCIKYLEQTKADNVGGPMRAVGTGTTGLAIALAHQSPFGLGGGAFHSDFEGFSDTVYLGCFPKETFAKYGRYDPRLTRNQDIELNARIRRGLCLSSDLKVHKAESADSSACQAGSLAQNDTSVIQSQDDMAGSKGSKNGVVNGNKPLVDSAALCEEGHPSCSPLFRGDKSAGAGKIYLTPKIKSHYRCRETLSGLWAQNFKNGQWGIYTRYIAPYALSLRHFIPLIFVTSLILLSALSLSGLGASLWGRGAGTRLANLLHGFKGLGLKQPGLFSLKAWSWHLLFLRMLALELFAYFSAMLFFVCQAGRSVQRAASSKQGATRGVEVKRFETVGEPGAEEAPGFPIKPGMTRRTGPDKDSIFSIQNSEFKPGSLALLPVVFLTLHFSYGLGSLWGLISLPYWAAGKQKR